LFRWNRHTFVGFEKMYQVSTLSDMHLEFSPEKPSQHAPLPSKKWYEFLCFPGNFKWMEMDGNGDFSNHFSCVKIWNLIIQLIAIAISQAKTWNYPISYM